MRHPVAMMIMENGARIVIELYPQAAPNTVNSFIYLANQGCFDNYAIQRIVPGYVADISYSAFGRAECKYLIANESRSHGAPNKIRVEPGVIGMGGYPQGIAGGEFFFPLGYHEKIDGHYPGFGYVREGWPEIERWGTVELKPIPWPYDPEMKVNQPLAPIVIREVRVETFGEDYPPPQKLAKAPLPPNWQNLT